MTKTSSRISALVGISSEPIEDDTLNAVCQDIALEIQSGRSKIHTVVEELGPYLTNINVTVRANGVKTLVTVISKLPKDYLNEQEVELLITFYFHRLSDHHSIVPCTILGILSLVQMKNLPRNAPYRLLFLGIFQQISCQSELQETRRNIYLTFQILLQTHTKELVDLGSDFVSCVIEAIDGESDPRNLMLLFNILPKFIKTFPLRGDDTKRMFEVVACYFPIDFNSTSITDENKKITREDLAKSLALCLHAIPEFAEFCLPLVMEKLDSHRKVAKMDSLSLLTQGAPIFGARGLKHHLIELWPMLKKETMSGGDREVKDAALSTVFSVVKAISESDEEVCRSFVETIFADTRWSLSDVQLSEYGPADKLLQTVASTGKNSCTQVLREVVPLCLGQYSTRTSINDKVALMETLNNFMRISTEFGYSIADIPELAWTDIPGLYLNELSTEDNNLKSRTLAGLIIQKSSLKEGQRATIYQKISELVNSELVVGEVRNMCHEALLAFAELYPEEMLSFLNKNLPIDVDNSDTAISSQRLEAISTLAKVPAIAVVVLPQILKIATSNCSSSEQQLDKTALSCLLRLLSSFPNNLDFDVHNHLYEKCETIDRLMRMEETASSEKLLLVASVCRSIVGRLSSEKQREVVEKYVTIQDGKPLAESRVLLLEGLLTPLRRDVLVKESAALLRELFRVAVESNSSSSVGSRSACKLFAVLMNKMAEDESFGRITNESRERIVQILEAEDVEMERKKAALKLHTWLTKSLVVKGSSNSQDFLDYQINILRLEPIGPFVPEEFKTLVDRSEDTLTEDNFCTIRIFYKQRIFQNVIEASRGFEAGSRQTYIVALALLMEEVPIELPIMHLERLVPLLIECLSLDDGQLLHSTLKILKVSLETKHEIFLDQIQCLISRFLQLSTYNKMNVRMAALDCLLSYCHYPVVELLKHKQEVLEKLGEAIDDRKRLVRQVAVKARTRWYLVGAPGMPD